MTRQSIHNLILFGCISAIVQAFNFAPSVSRSTQTVAFTRQSCSLVAMPSFSIEKSCLRMSTSAEDVEEGAAGEAEVEVMAEDEAEAEVVAEDEAEAVVETEIKAEAEDASAPVEEKKDEGYTAYVVNISYDTQNWQLREIFSPYGTVQRVFMPQDRDTGKSKGIAFVTMSTLEELEAAIADLHESQVDGRTMFVDKAKPRGSAAGRPKGRRGPSKENETKLYVGNLSYDTTTEDLVEYFTQFGDVRDVYIPTDRETGGSRGFGFLSMDTENAKSAIQESVGVELQGRQIQVNESLPKGKQAPRKTRNDTKIYVGNVPFDTSEESIVQLFEEYGPVVDFYMPIDRDFGRPRGFAFVTLATEAALTAMEELDGYELGGRFLRVNEAQPKGSFYEPRNDYNNDSYYNDDGADWGSNDGY